MTITKLALVGVLVAACGGGERANDPQPKSPAVAKAPVVDGSGSDVGSAYTDPTLSRDQDDYVAAVVAFTPGVTKEQVRARMKRGSEPLKEEWNKWEAEGPMTPERMTAFYKQTENYIYELAEWHLWVPGKRESDMQLVENFKVMKPQNILDFGGGVGLMAIPLAQAGFDVTLADLDSTTLKFGAFRAEKLKLPLKIWKTDVEAAPPDKKYDVIMALDVLEHLPKDILKESVDKLVKLKHKGTQIIISAPFGRTSVHPMHLDADEHTKLQVERLKNELPPDSSPAAPKH